MKKNIWPAAVEGFLAALTSMVEAQHVTTMPAAVAALGGDGPVCISGAEAVSKSYPAFFNDLQKISRL